MHVLVKRIIALCHDMTPHTNLWQGIEEPCVSSQRLQAKDEAARHQVYQTPFQSMNHRQR